MGRGDALIVVVAEIVHNVLVSVLCRNRRCWTFLVDLVDHVNVRELQLLKIHGAAKRSL